MHRVFDIAELQASITFTFGKKQIHSVFEPRQYKAWYGPTGNRNHHDERVHVCLYFLKPNQPMNAVDVEFMTCLQKWVPIVPVIGIADMVTNHQLQEQRKALEQVGAAAVKISNV